MTKSFMEAVWLILLALRLTRSGMVVGERPREHAGLITTVVVLELFLVGILSNVGNDLIRNVVHDIDDKVGLVGYTG